jgi:hypothetical protein
MRAKFFKILETRFFGHYQFAPWVFPGMPQPVPGKKVFCSPAIEHPWRFEAMQQVPSSPATVAPSEPLGHAVDCAELTEEQPGGLSDSAVPSLAEMVDPPVHPGRVRRAWRTTCSVLEWLFGVASLVVGLAVVATIPLVQMLSLGYLLEVAGRTARTGRIASGFIGVRGAARVGSIVAGAWLWLLPLRLVSTIAANARLIEPGGRVDRGWTIALWALSILIVAHILGACCRGGRLRHFLWPAPIRVLKLVCRRSAYSSARDSVCDFVEQMRIPYYFWLGLRGFAAGLVWMIVPVALLAAGRKNTPLGILGGILFGLVLLYLPFVQTRFAMENRFRAMFELRGARQLFRRAPWAFFMALLVTLLFALPLYLLKIQIVPRDAAWLPSLIFVAFTWPSRLLTGWAVGYAERRPAPRHWVSRQLARFSMVPVVAIYVGIAFLTQFTSWHGIWSLFEQHAFLLPVPFLGMK